MSMIICWINSTNTLGYNKDDYERTEQTIYLLSRIPDSWSISLTISLCPGWTASWPVSLNALTASVRPWPSLGKLKMWTRPWRKQPSGPSKVLLYAETPSDSGGPPACLPHFGHCFFVSWTMLNWDMQQMLLGKTALLPTRGQYIAHHGLEDQILKWLCSWLNSCTQRAFIISLLEDL